MNSRLLSFITLLIAVCGEGASASADRGGVSAAVAAKPVGVCFSGGLCADGLRCVRGFCHEDATSTARNRSRIGGAADDAAATGRRRPKRDAGVFCNNGNQAASMCFPSTHCGAGGLFQQQTQVQQQQITAGCCGSSKYYCEGNHAEGELCCTGPRPVTVTPQVSQPMVVNPPSQQGFCPPTQTDLGPCHNYNTEWCTLPGSNRMCVNGRCCQTNTNTNTAVQVPDDACLTHFVPKFGQNLQLCPLGKICVDQKCVPGTCQITPTATNGCPPGTKEVLLQQYNSYSYGQLCPSMNGAWINGKCCTPDAQPYQPSVKPQPLICPPNPCQFPFNNKVFSNNCCLRKFRR